MIRSSKSWLLGVLALALVLAVAQPIFADELNGTLTSINGDQKQFSMTDRDLGEHTFRMADNGKVLINNKEAQVSDLQAGEDVDVTFEIRNDQKVATLVRCTRNP